jgi:hypothetical protein
LAASAVRGAAAPPVPLDEQPAHSQVAHRAIRDPRAHKVALLGRFRLFRIEEPADTVNAERSMVRGSPLSAEGRRRRTPMQKYVGLDVHAASTTVAVITETGSGSAARWWRRMASR